MIESARPAIDLTRCAFVRELGDIRLYGTWLYDAENDDDEPALVLVPALRRALMPCVVPLSAAYRYTDPRHLAAVSLDFARTLGFDDTVMASANRIGTIIHDHLLDLIKMPENPTEAVVGATANVTLKGQRRTVEILDHVPLAQA